MSPQSIPQTLGYNIQVKHPAFCKHKEKNWLSSSEDNFSQDSISYNTFLAYTSSPRFYYLISGLLWMVKCRLLVHPWWPAQLCTSPLQVHFTPALHMAVLGTSPHGAQSGVLPLRLLLGGCEQFTWKRIIKKAKTDPLHTWQSFFLEAWKPVPHLSKRPCSVEDWAPCCWSHLPVLTYLSCQNYH